MYREKGPSQGYTQRKNQGPSHGYFQGKIQGPSQRYTQKGIGHEYFLQARETVHAVRSLSPFYIQDPILSVTYEKGLNTL
jgi:hypothetical protein